MPPHLLAVLRGRGLLVLQRRPRLALRLLHRRHVLPVLARGPQVPVQLGGGLQHAKKQQISRRGMQQNSRRQQVHVVHYRRPCHPKHA